MAFLVILAVFVLAQGARSQSNCPSSCVCDASTHLRTVACQGTPTRKLSTFPDISRVNYTVQSFDFTSNNLTTVPNGALDTLLPGLALMGSFKSTGNPFHCDCRLRYFASFLRKVRAATSTVVYDGSNPARCSTPASLSGVAVHTLQDDKLICNCSSMCQNGGLCDASIGKCVCTDGWLGEDCGMSCPSQTYGMGCNKTCDCVAESKPCNHITGKCYCQPGWNGTRCDQKCPEGSFGQDCQSACSCQNGAACHHVTGSCNCTTGWSSADCSKPCREGSFGFHCLQLCDCSPGKCNPFIGTCSCPPQYYGRSCKHNCSGSPACLALNRHECTLDTAEQTCGHCFDGHIGLGKPHNSQCTDCRSAPNCGALNRHNCSKETNMCGACFDKFLPQNETNKNQLCFDPCKDGMKNFNETDVDCGGTWCERCTSGSDCGGDVDCVSSSLCLGVHKLPSGLDYPFSVAENITCTVDEKPTTNLRTRLEISLAARQNSLSSIQPSDSLPQLVNKVQQELTSQLKLQPADISQLHVTSSSQAPGDPLFHLEAKTNDQRAFEAARLQAEDRIYRGELRGTVLLDEEQNQILLNV